MSKGCVESVESVGASAALHQPAPQASTRLGHGQGFIGFAKGFMGWSQPAEVGAVRLRYISCQASTTYELPKQVRRSSHQNVE